MLRQLALAAALLAAWNLAVPDATRAEDGEEESPAAAKTVDVRFADGSSIKLVLKHDDFVIHTPYGKLTIPAKDVRVIELAPRVAEDVAKKIEEAVANLASPQFEIREKAAGDLLRLGPLGYPVLLRLAKEKQSDLEVSARLDDILDKVRDKVPDQQGEPRPFDVVHTEHSRISGNLELNTVPAETTQFGEVQLKLADVRDLRFAGSIESDLSKAEPAPPHLYDKADQIGKTFTYRVTGNARGGTLWGTDTYTLDSSLAAAVVHAGVIKDGKTGVVRLKIVPPPPSFTGSTRNGVASHNFGPYPAAYTILKR